MHHCRAVYIYRLAVGWFEFQDESLDFSHLFRIVQVIFVKPEFFAVDYVFDGFDTAREEIVEPYHCMPFLDKLTGELVPGHAGDSAYDI